MVCKEFHFKYRHFTVGYFSKQNEKIATDFVQRPCRYALPLSSTRSFHIQYTQFSSCSTKHLFLLGGLKLNREWIWVFYKILIFFHFSFFFVVVIFIIVLSPDLWRSFSLVVFFFRHIFELSNHCLIAKKKCLVSKLP